MIFRGRARPGGVVQAGMTYTLEFREMRALGLAAFAGLALAGCGGDDGGSIYSETGNNPTVTASASDSQSSAETTSTTTDTEGGDCGYYEGIFFYPCEGEGVGEPIDCFAQGDVCVNGQGCLPCVPGETICQDNSIFSCDDNGQPGEQLEECDAAAGEICSNGDCVNACEAADDTPSNIGCEFWAADLPNERGISDASFTPWGVVLANAGQTPADVIIERNIAAVGEPESLVIVEDTNVPPGLLRTVMLPRAEVTGWTEDTTEPPGPPGTALSNNAFRIRSTAPIVVYQFNTFVNDFSTDASLLLPTSGLGQVHRVIGYPTANPIELIPIAGIPDRSSVTVIAPFDQTNVTIRAGTTTVSDMIGIPQLEPGDEYTLQLNKWQILNVASRGLPGDMTGTVVTSDKPISVFSAVERGIGPIYEGNDLPEPPDWDGGTCCTDHLEEQVFPASSLGTQFVVTRSPERSNGGWVEPDILRFTAVAEEATVTTNLPPPHDSFTLQPGEWHEGWATTDFVAESTTPIMVAQILVSQQYTTAVTGDPALTYFPATEQFRDRYVFLTPPTWNSNYFVLATPFQAGNDGPSMGNFTLDGGALPGDCVEQVAGEIGGVEYWSITCPIGEGAHLIEGDAPFGLTAYGYGPAGSYAYTGGADVKPIYDVPVIP